MGESAVLAHSYSFAAPITRTDSHEDHTNHALSQSISFGKFMTENLEWGKWSTFSHKKYVEEAEKYSRPGSVAQKKAFFEAHYKRIAEAKKAAAEEQPTVSPAEVLLQALETQPPLSLLPEEEPTTERKSIQNEDDEMEEEKESGLIGECDDDKEEEKEENEELLKEEKTRRSMTKNRPVFRLSLEKTIPPPKPIDTTRMEVASSEKTSEKPITQSSGKNEEKPVHRKKLSFLNCFRGHAKTRDQNQSRQKKGKRETKKQKKKQFLCLCFKPKTVRES
ncbi:Transcriptional regulator ATRX-like protein [Hirschfeldia incana]|nr:Transcriptional regulator ATRX-like protein [Hirschfeldia incana]